MNSNTPEHITENTVTLPRVAFIYVGDEYPVFEAPEHFYEWLNAFSELGMVSRITGQCIDVCSSTNSFAYITEIAQWITNHGDDFDGFVVFLPRAAFLYATQLLQLMIRESGKPIVCTTDYGMGAAPQFRSFESMLLKSDILNAVQTAASPVSGVMIVAGQEVVMPELAAVDMSGPRPVVRSRSVQLIGRMQFGFIPHPSAAVRTKRAIVCDPFSPDVVAFVQYGAHAQQEIRRASTQQEIRGLIIEAEQPAPISFVSHLPTHIPTLLTSTEGHQVFDAGSFYALPNMPAGLVSARFTWLRAHLPMLPATAIVDRITTWVAPQLTAGTEPASV